MKIRNSDTIALIENCHEIASKKLFFFNLKSLDILVCKYQTNKKKKCLNLKTITLGSN